MPTQKFKKLIGSRAQVMHGTAKKTGGGLLKKDLKYNAQGKIVSKRASKSAKKSNNLVNAGYVTQKGVFGAINTQKGGNNYPNDINVEWILSPPDDNVNFTCKRDPTTTIINTNQYKLAGEVTLQPPEKGIHTKEFKDGKIKFNLGGNVTATFTPKISGLGIDLLNSKQQYNKRKKSQLKISKNLEHNNTNRIKYGVFTYEIPEVLQHDNYKIKDLHIEFYRYKLPYGFPKKSFYTKLSKFEFKYILKTPPARPPRPARPPPLTSSYTVPKVVPATGPGVLKTKLQPISNILFSGNNVSRETIEQIKKQLKDERFLIENSDGLKINDEILKKLNNSGKKNLQKIMKKIIDELQRFNNEQEEHRVNGNKINKLQSQIRYLTENEKKREQAAMLRENFTQKQIKKFLPKVDTLLKLFIDLTKFPVTNSESLRKRIISQFFNYPNALDDMKYNLNETISFIDRLNKEIDESQLSPSIINNLSEICDQIKTVFSGEVELFQSIQKYQFQINLRNSYGIKLIASELPPGIYGQSTPPGFSSKLPPGIKVKNTMNILLILFIKLLNFLETFDSKYKPKPSDLQE